MRFVFQYLAAVMALIRDQALAAPTASGVEPLVKPQWLLDNLKNPDLVIVDIRVTDSYLSAHIPGALSLPYTAPSIWSRAVNGDTLIMPPAEELLQDLGKNGINRKKNIVIVTSTAQLPLGVVTATRVATTLQFAGHDMSKVGVLDGGMEAWNRIKAPTSTATVTPKATKYTGNADPSFIVDRAYVHGSLNKLSEGVALIDARTSSAYADGHIESALTLPMTNMLEADGTFKPVAELLEAFKAAVGDAPVDATKGEVIVYCWVGLMASGWYYALAHIMHFANVKFYDGSLEDWVLEYPVVKE